MLLPEQDEIVHQLIIKVMGHIFDIFMLMLRVEIFLEVLQMNSREVEWLQGFYYFSIFIRFDFIFITMIVLQKLSFIFVKIKFLILIFILLIIFVLWHILIFFVLLGNIFNCVIFQIVHECIKWIFLWLLIIVFLFLIRLIVITVFFIFFIFFDSLSYTKLIHFYTANSLMLCTTCPNIILLLILISIIIYNHVCIIKIQQMKTERRTPNTPDLTTNSPASSRPRTSDLVDHQIKTKFNTFINWDPKSYLRNRRNERMNKKQQAKTAQNNQVFNALFKYANDMRKKQQRKKMRKNINTGRVSISSKDHRQKFKRLQNPLQFIHYYIQNNKFQPNQDEQRLIDKLVQIKALLESMESINLERVLEQIYKLMNMTVDFNELKLLILSIILAADICIQAKDINRSFYFYNQAKMASLYAGLCQITVQSLIGMAKIAHEIGHIGSSLKFLKKALAYCWRVNDTDSQIQVYDLMGQNYCEQGKMDKADYYHQRFARNETQQQKSVIKKIYLDIIKDDAKNRNLRLYNEDVDMLILETLNLPIYNFQIFPAFKSSIEKANYINGESPRKFINKPKFTYAHFQAAQSQIEKVIAELQFEKQMPNPDIQVPYVQIQRHGKSFERNVDFSRTLQFHQIIGAKMEPTPVKINKRYSIEKQIQLLLAQKPDPKWYQKMSKNVKQQRLQKLGSLKGAIHKSHLKIQRQKRSLSSQSQNIRKSVNKAILNWIDPLQ